jgi:uncharacterized protein (TIGR03492 family)
MKRHDYSLLCLSNGHGEDAIAVRILEEVQKISPNLEIAALPIVGEGKAYSQIDIPIVGSVKNMPSGGFVYMDGRQLIGDIKGGLLQLTWQQIQTIRTWINDCKKLGKTGTILAVGDLVPLLFAYYSGVNYAFVGTAKSEYYLRDELGLLPRTHWFERLESWFGSVYSPVERWLMSRSQCQAVFPRDSLTTNILKQWSIPAYDLGNPMMDRIFPEEAILNLSSESSEIIPNRDSFTITLLPGSRIPEAYENWDKMAIAIESIRLILPETKVEFLAAIALSLECDRFTQTLLASGWLQKSNYVFFKDNLSLTLSQQSYQEYLLQGDLAIAMAGTATEQFVGLGKPAITIPGKGPQFTPRFAEAQTRLLGSSAILVEDPQQVGKVLEELLQEPQRWQAIARNGKIRMGKPGAASRIASCLLGVRAEERGDTEKGEGREE